MNLVLFLVHQIVYAEQLITTCRVDILDCMQPLAPKHKINIHDFLDQITKLNSPHHQWDQIKEIKIAEPYSCPHNFVDENTTENYQGTSPNKNRKAYKFHGSIRQFED